MGRNLSGDRVHHKQWSIQVFFRCHIFLNFTYNFVKKNIFQKMFFICVKNIFVFEEKKIGKKYNLGFFSFLSFLRKLICGRTSVKYFIKILNFRVRFKVSDFCKGSVLRSPIFVKGLFSDPIYSWMNPCIIII